MGWNGTCRPTVISIRAKIELCKFMLRTIIGTPTGPISYQDFVCLCNRSFGWIQRTTNNALIQSVVLSLAGHTAQQHKHTTDRKHHVKLVPVIESIVKAAPRRPTSQHDMVLYRIH